MRRLALSTRLVKVDHDSLAPALFAASFQSKLNPVYQELIQFDSRRGRQMLVIGWLGF